MTIKEAKKLAKGTKALPELTNLETQIKNNNSKPSKKPRVQREKKFHESILLLCRALGIPAIHIDYYCGNVFPVICPRCKTVHYASCRKLNNIANRGHGDVIGIAWEIETKTKPRKSVIEDSQKATMELFERLKTPYLLATDHEHGKVQEFIKSIYPEKFL